MKEHGSYISLVDDTVNYVHDILCQFFIIFLKNKWEMDAIKSEKIDDKKDNNRN